MRTLSEPEKKIVAARQQWKCSTCQAILPAAYQVDHTIPLCDGGADNIKNCTAMCANCHAAKTQLESIARHRHSTSAATQYAAREDVYILGTDRVKCSLCRRERDHNLPHSFCTAIESHINTTLHFALSRFAFTPRYCST